MNIVETHLSTNAKDFAEFIHFAQTALHSRFEQVMMDEEPDALKKQMKLEGIIEEIKTRLPDELRFGGEAPDEHKNGYAHYPQIIEEEEEAEEHGDDEHGHDHEHEHGASCGSGGCGHDHHHHHDHDHDHGMDDEEEEEGEEEEEEEEADVQMYTKKNTFHLDAFLYTDEEVDRMAQHGMIPRSYCLDCGSRNTDFLNYVSNSLSSEQLEIIFGYRALAKVFPASSPQDFLKGKKIVDVGSRLGAVLYYAHIFTQASEVVGIELNKYFVDLCQKVVKGHKMNDRIRLVNSDVFKQTELVHGADIVIMHNVFEWFANYEQQKNIWQRVRRELLTKSGQIIVSTPALEQSVISAGVDLDEFDFDSWVRPIPLGKSVDEQQSKHCDDDDDCCATGACASSTTTAGCCDNCCEKSDPVCAEDCALEHEHHRHNDPNHQHHNQPNKTGIYLYRVL